MQPQPLLDRERLAAQVAREQRIRAVLGRDVVLQAAGLPEPVLAVRTRVRPLVVVDAQMLPQIVRPHEGLVAHVAHVLLASLLVLVGFGLFRVWGGRGAGVFTGGFFLVIRKVDLLGL